MVSFAHTDRRLPLTVVLLALSLWVVRPPFVLSSDAPDDDIDPSLLKSIEGLAVHMGRLDWDEQYPLVKQAIENVWEKNGWTDESDRYARDLACEVVAIPPSEPLRRLNLLNKRIAERYGLREGEAARFRLAMMREIGGLMMRHAGVIIEQTRDILEARADGVPYTAEQVARWTQESRPLIAEVFKSTERLTNELEPMLEPAKRRTFELDLKSYEKRRKFTDRMTIRWTRGKWRPEDWGLQDDPIHRRAAPSGGPIPARPGDTPTPRTERSTEPAATRWVSHDPSTWHAYVLAFKKRFGLDAGQMSTAESVHAELLERAKGYMAARGDALAAVAPRERETHEAYEPIRQLFTELQDRLSAIPTTSQRKRNNQ